ncbi:MAG: M48 family metalloprotease [Desulfovibrionales bacterium]
MFLLVLLSLFLTGCEEMDITMATQAGADAVRAITLDDEDVQRMALEVSRQSDLQHVVAAPDNPYARRLQSVAGGYEQISGHNFNFKVYLSPTVNAFAMADGSIRIYSGLMDMLDDRELLFVVGHEMGHVVEKHIKEKIRVAYAGSAVRKAVASQRSEAGYMARSVVGALAESLLNAQFSQQEEREADDYGLMIVKQAGHGEDVAISALMKLATLGNDHSFLSSHPAPEKRAERLKSAAQSHEHDRSSLMDRALNLCDELLAGLSGLWAEIRSFLGKLLGA